MDDRPLLRDESEEEVPASWRKFSIILTGRTNGAHQSVVRTFKSVGQTEATSPGDADYCLAFCPISSRVGTDVSEAMDHLPAGKDAVLVVMHHTFNPEQVIPPSRRVVTDRRVQLTLDCLFHQNNLLSCELNRNMENDIKRFFRASWFQMFCQWILWFLLMLPSPVTSPVLLIAARLQLVLDQTGLRHWVIRFRTRPWRTLVNLLHSTFTSIKDRFGIR
ncbi:uncharacterized protein LOC115401728 [Salarias fasciatus]|uniref:uncharacterized protein LOC115401728 n=1 Tax=Salarias fasciatus TaxID=181472 RepID=UPI0011766558|nr:uncharacterized protein LOC115401728 [Salarias fasciatus]